MLAIKLDQGSSMNYEQNLKSWTSSTVNVPISSLLSEIDEVHVQVPQSFSVDFWNLLVYVLKLMCIGNSVYIYFNVRYMQIKKK